MFKMHSHVVQKKQCFNIMPDRSIELQVWRGASRLLSRNLLTNHLVCTIGSRRNSDSSKTAMPSQPAWVRRSSHESILLFDWKLPLPIRNSSGTSDS